MTTETVFARRTAFWLVAIGATAFAAAAFFAIFGDSAASWRNVGANAYSRSAIGHRLLVDTLGRLDMPVVVSRSDSVARAGEGNLLVVAEPVLGGPDADDPLGALLEADPVLLILPKRDGWSDPARPGWLETAALRPASDVEAVVRRVLPDAAIVRPDTADGWYPALDRADPALPSPQLIRSPTLKPLIRAEEGTLLGLVERDGQRIWVLSDPDLIANHGIGLDDNALWAVEAIDQIRPLGGTVIIDETIHGFLLERSLWRLLFRFPFVVATICACVAIAVLLWATGRRFGVPEPGDPPLKAGVAQLIDTTAGLFRLGNHGAEVLRRYFAAAMRQVAQRHHLHDAPSFDPGGEGALAARLDKLAKARGLAPRCAALHRGVAALSPRMAVDDPRLAAAAEEIHQWKREMIHGPGDDPRHRP